MIAEITRSYYLPALHRLFDATLTQEENEFLYGPCCRLHGHDYFLDITLRGMIHPETGLVFSRDQMDSLVDEALVARFSKVNLNDHFNSTSGESLAAQFLDLLEPVLPAGVQLKRIALRETAKNTFIAEHHSGHSS